MLYVGIDKHNDDDSDSYADEKGKSSGFWVNSGRMR